MKTGCSLFYKFCSTFKDRIYEFDRSAVSLSLKLDNLKSFQEYPKLNELKINRIIYDLTSQEEILDFSSRTYRYLDQISIRQFIIGIKINTSIVFKDGKLRKLDSKALLQVCQHLFKLKGENKQPLQLFLGLETEQFSDELLPEIQEELDDLQSVIENSFNFELNHTLQHSKIVPFDSLFKLTQQWKTNKSVDFNIFKYADTTKSEIDQNQQILATLYQNATPQFNTLFLKNFDSDQKEDQDISQGIVSYTHFFDMLKLMHFKGSIVLENNKCLEKNVQFIDQHLLNSKYWIVDKATLDDRHEEHITVDQSTLINI
ncbi:hypothetical protein pb186bvf_002186 [Paramecium bursaria]